MGEIKCQQFEQFGDFVEEVTRRGVKLVKLANYGFREAIRKQGGVWIEPRVKLIATAFSKSDNVIMRWEETVDAQQMVTVLALAGTSQALHNEQTVMDRKASLKMRLEMEGLNVADGEWSPQSIEYLLAHSA
ncbi:MAG: hypothetical protein ABSE73_16960 [Planctomycetota bacterium]